MFLFRWLGVVNFWTGKCINFQGKSQPVAVSPPMGPQNVGALVLKGWLEPQTEKGGGGGLFLKRLPPQAHKPWPFIPRVGGRVAAGCFAMDCWRFRLRMLVLCGSRALTSPAVIADRRLWWS